MMHVRTPSAVVLLTNVVAMAGCTTSYKETTEELNYSYELGKKQRVLMTERGALINDKSCAATWVPSGAQGDQKHDWKIDPESTAKDELSTGELRRQYFINGCMNRSRADALPSSTTSALAPSATSTRK